MQKGYNLDILEAKIRDYLLAGNINPDSVTLKNYLSDIRIFIDWLFYTQNSRFSHESDITQLLKGYFNQKSVADYKNYLVESKTPDTTINRRLSSIRHLNKFCVKEKIIEDQFGFHVKNIYNKVERELNNSLRKKDPTKQAETQQKIFSNQIDILPNGQQTPSVIFRPAGSSDSSIEQLHHTISHWPHILYSVLFVLVFALLVGNGNYVKEKTGNLSGQTNALESGRTLAFQGRLSDSLGNKIPFATDVRFRLYNVEKGGTAIYDSGSCAASPDKDGFFKVTIGSNGCGARIPNSLFEKNPSLYIGIKVGKDKEIAVRQRIPNTNLAQNTNYLQGFPIGTSNGSIPYISNDGILKLSDSSPVINSTAEEGVFKVRSASDIALESGKSSDVHIITGENGSVHFRNQNSQLDNLLIANDGNVSIGTGIPGLFKLEVGGSIGPSLDSIYDLGSSAKTWNNLYVNKICFNTVLDCIEGGYTDYWTTGEGYISPLNNESDLLLGATATSSAQIKLSSTAGNPSFIRSGYLGVGTTAPISALHVEGTLTLTGNVTDIITSNNENLTLSAHGTGIIVINDAVKLGSDTSGVYIDANGVLSDLDGSLVLGDDVYLGSESSGIKVTANGEISDTAGAVTVNDDLTVNNNFTSGASSTSGTTTLDIGGTGTANALCHSTAGGTDNEAIVDCTSSPTADFAEMYPVEESARFGDVMALSNIPVKTSDGQTIRKLVKNSDPYDNRIIGIVSNNYGDFISVGHNISSTDNPMPIALKGRVPVNIDPSSRAIRAGDYLTGSKLDGMATKADRAGMMIGQALEDWSPDENKATVMVFVRTSYADPTPFADKLFSYATNALNTVTGNLFVEKEIFSPVVRTGQLIAGKISTEYIYSPVVEAETVTTATIRAPDNKDISIALDDKDNEASSSGDLARLIIKGLQDRPVATIDAAGNITAQGTVTAKEASFSGALAAKEVKADNITQLKDSLERTVLKTDGIDRLGNSINEIQSVLSKIQNQPLAPLTDPIEMLPDTLADPRQSEGLFSNLTVTGTTSLFQLSVQNGITSLSDELKLSAASTINLLDGAAVLTKDGNLTLNGTLIAKSGVKTNDIRPIDLASDIRAHLNTSVNGNSSFKFLDQNGSTVAQIDASGSARFNSLALDNTDIASASAIIGAAENYLENGQYIPAINSRRANAGSAIIPPGEEEIIIYNEAVNTDSLIYLTPTGNNPGSTLAIVEKQSCTPEALQNLKRCKPYFKVNTQPKNEAQIGFNWLIIN